jgi:hypothetical protein
VQVDIENVGFTLGPVDDVCVPHLLGKGRAHDLLLLALLRRKWGRLAIDLRMLVPARSFTLVVISHVEMAVSVHGQL